MFGSAPLAVFGVTVKLDYFRNKRVGTIVAEICRKDARDRRLCRALGPFGGWHVMQSREGLSKWVANHPAVRVCERLAFFWQFRGH